jgi:flavin reductase (DIM6/NTAB) family NADH-FMN oxidoreductase RutF
MITRDLRALGARESYRILSSLIVPRPIAWISSVDSDGIVNLAPFSSFMGIFNPPMAGLVLGRRLDGSLKDTHQNLRERGECVIHIPDAGMMEAMHASAEDLPAGESELARLGLATLPSQVVRPPLLAEAPIALECRLNREIALSPTSTLVLVDVVVVHVRESIWSETYECADSSLWEPVARLASVAGPNYAELGTMHQLGTPKLPPL